MACPACSCFSISASVGWVGLLLLATGLSSTLTICYSSSSSVLPLPSFHPFFHSDTPQATRSTARVSQECLTRVVLSRCSFRSGSSKVRQDLSLPASSASVTSPSPTPCGASLLRMRSFSRVCSLVSSLRKVPSSPCLYWDCGTILAPLIDLSFLSVPSFPLPFSSAYCVLSSLLVVLVRDSRMSCSTWREIQKYLAKSLYLLLCLSWLCWCWRHAACVMTYSEGPRSVPGSRQHVVLM